LNWLILQDENVEKYELEFSDGKNVFSLLQTIESDGIAAARNYQTTHFEAAEGDNFYRVKVIRKDGSSYFSSPRLVHFDFDFERVNVFPNPTADLIYVDLSVFVGKKGTVEIVNQFGQIVMQRDLEEITLEPEFFDVKKLASGIYNVVVKVEGERLVAKKVVVTQT